MNSLRTLLVAAAVSLPAFGNPAPISDALTNGKEYIQFNGSSFPGSNLICPSGAAGCGGGFQATVYNGTSASGLGTLTTVWCVDYQLDVTTSSQYVTDIKTLNDISTPTDSNVRYGGLNSVETPTTTGWANGLTGGGGFNAGPTTLDGGNSNSAAYRYTLAAALVSQYVDTSNVRDPANLNGSSPVNLAIQEAIWYITYNNQYDSTKWAPFNLPAATFSGTSDYGYWVNYALSHASGVDLNKWAVVSGPADATTGNLLNPANVGGYASYQTFLVQVVPEPAYYLVSILGVAGILLAARRRAQVKAAPAA